MPKDPTIAVRDCLAEIAILQALLARHAGEGPG